MYFEQYVLRDSSKIMGNKDKSAYSLVRKQDDQQLNDKSINSASISGNDALEGENGIFLNAGLGILNDDNMLCFSARLSKVILVLNFLL